MALTEAQLARLPKYARDEITSLTGNVAYLREKVTAGPADSDTFARVTHDQVTPLGRGVSVEFRLDAPSLGAVEANHTNRDEMITCRVDYDAGRQQFYLYVNAGQPLAVTPESSNAVGLRLVPR